MSDILESIKAAYEEGFDDGMQMHRSDFDDRWNASNDKLIYDSIKAARESEGGEAVAFIDPQSLVNFKNEKSSREGAWRCNDGDLIPLYTRPPNAATPQPDKWIPCSERLPTEADEDERHDLWTCLKDVNGKMHVARNNAAFVEMFAQQRYATKFWWMPTGLIRPIPPEQESE